MTDWYYRSPGQDPVGPVSTAGLQKLLERGRLDPGDEVCQENTHQWLAVSRIQKDPSLLLAPTSGHAPKRSTSPLIWILALLVLLGPIATWFFMRPGGGPDSTASPSTEPQATASPEREESLPTAAESAEPSAPKASLPQTVAQAPKDNHEFLRAQYRMVADSIEAGHRVICSFFETGMTPLPQVLAELGEIKADVTDPRLVEALNQVEGFWRSIPESLPMLEPNSLEALVTDLLVNQVYDGLEKEWSRILGGIQENCWERILPIAEEEWGAAPAAHGLATVTLEPSKSGRHELDIHLVSTAAQPLTDATVRVEFERLGVAPIVNFYFFDTWAPGEPLNLSEDPRLALGASLVVSSSISIWSNEARQDQEQTLYPERRAIVEARIRRAEAIKANREALESALAKKQRLEGAWALGERSGPIGFELVQAESHGGIFAKPNIVRIYAPENPATYLEYEGMIKWNESELRFELALSGKRGGIKDQLPRLPSTTDYLKRGSRSITLFGERDDFRGLDSAGASIQLAPKGSELSTRLLTHPEQVALQPRLLAKGGLAIEPQLLASAPKEHSSQSGSGEEVGRWDALSNEFRYGTSSHIDGVQLADEDKTLYWINTRHVTRLTLGSSPRFVNGGSSDQLSLSKDERYLVTRYSNKFRTRDPLTLEETGPKDPNNTKGFRSPRATAVAALSSGSVAFGDSEGNLSILDRRGRQTHSFQQSSAVSGVCVTEEPAVLFSATKDGNINLWDLSSDEYLCQLRGTRTLLDARVSSDGKVAMTIESLDKPGSIRKGSGHAIRLWDGVTGEKLQELIFSNTSCLAVSDDWRRAAFGVRNRGEVFIWDLVTGACTTSLLGHRSSIECADFSASGQKLITGDSDGWAILWDLP